MASVKPSDDSTSIIMPDAADDHDADDYVSQIPPPQWDWPPYMKRYRSELYYWNVNPNAHIKGEEVAKFAWRKVSEVEIDVEVGEVLKFVAKPDVGNYWGLVCILPTSNS